MIKWGSIQQHNFGSWEANGWEIIDLADMRKPELEKVKNQRNSYSEALKGSGSGCEQVILKVRVEGG